MSTIKSAWEKFIEELGMTQKEFNELPYSVRNEYFEEFMEA